MRYRKLWLTGAEGREHPAVRYRCRVGSVVFTKKVKRRGTRDMRTLRITISQFVDWDSARSGQLQPRRPMRVCRPKEDGRSAGACTFTVRAKPRRPFTASIMTIGAWHSLVCRRLTAPQPPRVLSTSLLHSEDPRLLNEVITLSRDLVHIVAGRIVICHPPA